VVAIQEVPSGMQLTVGFTMELRGSDKPAVVAEALYRFQA
jgi:hypothetical protein